MMAGVSIGHRRTDEMLLERDDPLVVTHGVGSGLRYGSSRVNRPFESRASFATKRDLIAILPEPRYLGNSLFALVELGAFLMPKKLDWDSQNG